MPTNESQLPTPTSSDSLVNLRPSLTRKIKQKTKTEERADQRALAERRAWDIEKVIAEQAADTPKDSQQDWVRLLDAVNKHTEGGWAKLDKALAPYCMGATGPMNPKTGQYLIEIRMVRGQLEQVDRAIEGFNVLLPILKRSGGAHELQIKCHALKYREKNWLSVKKDGSAQVLSNMQPAAVFADLRSALIFICENRPAAEDLSQLSSADNVKRINL